LEQSPLFNYIWWFGRPIDQSTLPDLKRLFWMLDRDESVGSSAEDRMEERLDIDLASRGFPVIC